MSWTKKELKRSYSCNVQLFRKLRKSLGFSQKRLALHAGYSERLISKIEAGGSVAMATIEVMSSALSTPDRNVTPAELINSPSSLAKTAITSLYKDRETTVASIRSMLADDVVFRITGEASQLPFAGTHVGIDAMDRAVKRLFSLVEVDAQEDSLSQHRFHTSGDEVLVWGERRMQPIGKPLEDPIPVTNRLRFRNGQLYYFECRYCVGNEFVKSA